MSETPYAETEALLALLNGDERECVRILLDSHPHELIKLARVAGRLKAKAEAACRIVSRQRQAASPPGVSEEVDRALVLLAARHKPDVQTEPKEQL